MSLATATVLGALALDVVVGEPPDRAHPVAWFGTIVAVLDRPWKRPRLVGAVAALTLPLGAALLGGGAVVGVGTVDARAALVAGTLVLFVSTSFRALLGTVRRVSELADADLPAARTAVVALAGRDATALDAPAVRSAALESLAENLADGLVAPLLAFSVGAGIAAVAGVGPVATLAFACAGAVWIKGVNTMDSMVGYPDRQVGTWVARVDDAAMWLPARVAAGLISVWFADPGALRRASTWTAAVASPNSGWPMGTLAAALGVRLEKPGHYVLNPTGSSPTHEDTRLALRRVGLAALSAYGLAGAIAWS